jgi:hypothetical protein
VKKLFNLIGFSLVGIAAAAATGVVYELKRRKLLRTLLADAAEEGYETAYDIKNPQVQGLRQKKKDLKYGPTIYTDLHE